MSKTIIKLSQKDLIDIVQESVRNILKEHKDIFQEKKNKVRTNAVAPYNYLAKSKKGAKLNDYELARLFNSILQDLVKSERLSDEDAELLAYYGMYNNDCFTHR